MIWFLLVDGYERTPQVTICIRSRQGKVSVYPKNLSMFTRLGENPWSAPPGTSGTSTARHRTAPARHGRHRPVCTRFAPGLRTAWSAPDQLGTSTAGTGHRTAPARHQHGTDTGTGTGTPGTGTAPTRLGPAPTRPAPDQHRHRHRTGPLGMDRARDLRHALRTVCTRFADGSQAGKRQICLHFDVQNEKGLFAPNWLQSVRKHLIIKHLPSD